MYFTVKFQLPRTFSVSRDRLSFFSLLWISITEFYYHYPTCNGYSSAESRYFVCKAVGSEWFVMRNVTFRLRCNRQPHDLKIPVNSTLNQTAQIYMYASALLPCAAPCSLSSKQGFFPGNILPGAGR